MNRNFSKTNLIQLLTEVIRGVENNTVTPEKQREIWDMFIPQQDTDEIEQNQELLQFYFMGWYIYDTIRRNREAFGNNLGG